MGLFITFEGVEGCGKSTQSLMLSDYMECKGQDVLRVREPGSTMLGEKLRSILVNSSDDTDDWLVEDLDLRAELFLYEASRAQLIGGVIQPALKAGKHVICDRFIDSTVAYQSYGRGLSIDTIQMMNTFASYGLMPDITLLIDCDVELGLKRAGVRTGDLTEGAPREDRFERESLAFHRSIREGFLKIAEGEGERIKVIDGARDVDTIHEEVRALVDGLISATASLKEA